MSLNDWKRRKAVCRKHMDDSAEIQGMEMELETP